MNRTIVGILGLSLLGLSLLATKSPIFEGSTASSYPEVTELAMNPPDDFDAYRAYFDGLARRKGATYAYEVLLRTSLPPGIDTHLIAHYVGYVLYGEKGIAGIADCTQDFRNACSHSMVISAFLEHGEGALPDIERTCREAPGGRGAYAMCFHGLGHGILAYLDYDLEKTIPLCVAATSIPNEATSRLAPVIAEQNESHARHECISGAVMEMIDGVHDRDAWLAAKPRFLPPSDLLMPCDADFMPADARPLCYSYLSKRFFETAGIPDFVGTPPEKAVREVFALCDRIPEAQKRERDACWGGMGEEFVASAAGRDIRNVANISSENLAKVHEWCALAPRAEAREACIMAARGSLFWGGENDPRGALVFCDITNDPVMRDTCYVGLADDALYFLGKTPAILPVCAGLPEPHRSFCVENGT